LNNPTTKFDEIAWQGCLDHANKNAAEARGEADRLRAQLFEAREQRDEARAVNTEHLKAEAANPGASYWAGMFLQADQERIGLRKAEIKMRLEAARALTEVDALRKQRDEHKCMPAYAPTPPHDHVVMSLAAYTNIVKERDEALAKFAACVDVVSFVDGRWVRTS
jgi:hypothetical protein